MFTARITGGTWVLLLRCIHLRRDDVTLRDTFRGRLLLQLIRCALQRVRVDQFLNDVFPVADASNARQVFQL